MRRSRDPIRTFLLALALPAALALGACPAPGPNLSQGSPTPVDTIPPTFAGITSATDHGDGTAILAWSPASDDLTPPGSILYEAYLDSSGSLGRSMGGVTGLTSMVTLPLVGPATFLMRARDQAGNSDSNTKTATVTVTIQAKTLSGDVQPIFNTSCALAGCHTGATPASGLNLTSGVAYANTVNVAANESLLKYVLPGDALDSYLYVKITDLPGISGVQMPNGSTPLPASEIATIREWILAGAPNN